MFNNYYFSIEKLKKYVSTEEQENQNEKNKKLN